MQRSGPKRWRRTSRHIRSDKRGGEKRENVGVEGVVVDGIEMEIDGETEVTVEGGERTINKHDEQVIVIIL